MGLGVLAEHESGAKKRGEGRERVSKDQAGVAGAVRVKSPAQNPRQSNY